MVFPFAEEITGIRLKSPSFSYSVLKQQQSGTDLTPASPCRFLTVFFSLPIDIRKGTAKQLRRARNLSISWQRFSLILLLSSVISVGAHSPAAAVVPSTQCASRVVSVLPPLSARRHMLPYRRVKLWVFFR